MYDFGKTSKEKENPFYYNYLFSKRDLDRAIFSRLNWFWLWIFPTFTQIVDEYIFYYKIVNGRYWITKIEKLVKKEII